MDLQSKSYGEVQAECSWVFQTVVEDYTVAGCLSILDAIGILLESFWHSHHTS